MPFAAAYSTARDSIVAVTDALHPVMERLGRQPDLVVAFFSPHHADHASELGGAIQTALAPGCVIGCLGESIIGNEREIEGEPALSLWAARWTGKVKLEAFHLRLERTADGPSFLGWPDGLVEGLLPESAMILLGDPFSMPMDAFLAKINAEHAGFRVVGGMASGVRGPGQCRLLLNHTVHDRGAVGVVLQGPIGLRSVVSQGCRPIGQHFVITKADKNLIQSLGGRTPLAVLQELWNQLDEHEQRLFQDGLHLGRVLNEYQSDFQRGDFLIRNIIGIDRDSGALGINDMVRVGQTVQFHVRDAETADEDLHALLQLDMNAHDKKPAGALLFSCNGRGQRLFQQPDHDAGALREEAGAIPVAGFFAQGELGPVGGQNIIHGFTASVALFEE